MPLFLEAEKRKANVKNITRKAPAAGFIPAVMYNSQTNIPLKVSKHDLEKLFPKLKANSIINLKVDGKEEKVLVKDYDEDLRTREITHVDFYLIDPRQLLKVKIPVITKGVCPGVKKGGLIQTFINDLETRCNVDKIPDHFEVDVSTLDIGSQVHVADLTQEKDVEILADPQDMVLSIVQSAKAISVSTPAETEAEGETEAETPEGEQKEESAEESQTPAK
ncbi:MAG TPA: 50S ribosomal protein L25 [Spirochaetota bacterium]|nr:50S ribosomal protein L25 [Spirochaetota bacterium]